MLSASSKWFGIAMVLAMSGPVVGQESAPAKDLAALRIEIVKGLEPLAAWCQDNGLFKERDRCWRTILHIEPDHAAARKALLYTRQADGTWRQSPGYHEPTTTNRQKADEFAKRWTAVAEPYLATALEVVAANKATIPAAERERILDLAAELGPDDPRVREARGEGRVGNRWVLRETANAVASRRHLAESAAKFLSAGKTRDIPVEGSLAIPGLDWKFAARSGRVTAIATTSADDARAVAQQGHAALELVDALFPGDGYRGAAVTVYIVAGEAQAKSVIAARPLERPPADFLAGAGGAWLHPYDTLAVSMPDARLRVDTAVRAMIDAADSERFQFSDKLDVLSQGVTTVITHVLSGTRKMQSTSAADSDPKLVESLSQKGADWEKAARDFLHSGKWPKPEAALAAEVPIAPPPAEIYGHFAAAFILLGRPDKSAAVLQALGGKGTPKTAIETVLETNLDAFDARLRRWMDEMAETAPADSRKPPK